MMRSDSQPSVPPPATVTAVTPTAQSLQAAASSSARRPAIRLSEAEWQERQAAHRARLAALLGDYAERRRRQEKHPVTDFLFTYYSFSLGRLERWTPGYGVILEGHATQPFLHHTDYVAVDLAGDLPGTGAAIPAVALARERFPAKRRDNLRWIIDLLRRTAARPPFFGCFGLHEWAMVYRAADVRHPYPLRLGNDGVAGVVESLPIVCTHYDAYRFFTPAAAPLNRLGPTADDRSEHEQPGCLHANMDLYKWAYKLYPWLPGELLADCFALAMETRTLDMRASPYDLRALGYAPIAIETVDGRREYVEAQARLAELAAPLRARLVDALDDFLGWLDA